MNRLPFKSIMLAELGGEYVRIGLAQKKHADISAVETYPTPAETGEPVDFDLLRMIFDEYMKQNRIKRADVRIILHHPDAVVRFKILPRMKPADLDKAVRSGIADLFPDDGSLRVYDYRVNYTENGSINAVIISLPEDASGTWARFFISLGLTPVSLNTYADAVSVYLERNIAGDYAAVFENQNSVSVLGFSAGRLVSARDIACAAKAPAVVEMKKYLLALQPDDIYLFTNIGMISEADDPRIKRIAEPCAAFYGALGV